MLSTIDKLIYSKRTSIAAKILELFSVLSLFIILALLVFNSAALVVGFKYLFFFVGSYLSLYRGLVVIEKILEICSALSRLKQLKNKKN